MPTTREDGSPLPSTHPSPLRRSSRPSTTQIHTDLFAFIEDAASTINPGPRRPSFNKHVSAPAIMEGPKISPLSSPSSMMGLPQSAIKQLECMPPIDPSNFQKGKQTLKAFFNGVHADWIRDAYKDPKKPTTVPSGKESDDSEIHWILYTKLAPDYQYLVQELTSGLEAWKAIVTHFDRTSNLATRVDARAAFSRFEHDPTKTMDAYISGLVGARQVLTNLGCMVEDGGTVDTLLMNLHASYSNARASILNQKDEPNLETVMALLLEAQPNKFIPGQSSESPAITVATRAYPPHDHGRYGGAPLGGGLENFHWCSATANDQCRRCGRTGHIADNCVYDMPQHVRDWVMAGPPKADQAKTAYAAFNPVFDDNR